MTVTVVSKESDEWWKHAVVYQVYPSTFKDSNGDGMGDIPGIIEKLDYIKSIGTDVIWLSPHYKSPQKDVGYDISDYKDVWDKFGSLDDCFELIDSCHERGIKIIFDLVVNHTSDEHEWFIESAKSKDSAKRDWYIWRPAKYDEHGNRMPPNNWASYFGGSAWEWHEPSQEYYLHIFVKEQPDLNWENLEMRKAVYQDAILFWLDRGVDGFRIDTVSIYSKPSGLPDAPVTDPNTYFQTPRELINEGLQLHEIIREMNKIGFGKYNVMTVGESQASSYDEITRYVNPRELSMLFQFEVVRLGIDKIKHTVDAFNLLDFKCAIERWQLVLSEKPGSWTTVFLENHDIARSVSRFGNDSTPELAAASAKLLATMLGTLSGTLFLYQGQEIGMTNAPADWGIEEYKDVNSWQQYDIVKERNDIKQLEKFMDYLRKTARDHARTPMQWDGSEYAGFTSSSASSATSPWMSVNPNYSDINVAKQKWDPYSVLCFWQNIVKFRKSHLSLTVYGEFEQLDRDNAKVFSYVKADGQNKLFVILNFSSDVLEYEMPKGQLLLSTHPNRDAKSNVLQPYEGVVIFAQV